jgi:hypothetical protein
MNFIFVMILFFIAGFCLGKLTRFFDPKQSGLSDSLPYGDEHERPRLELRAFISEIYDQYSRVTTPSRFSVSVTNLSQKPVELLSWFMRFKSIETNISRKIEFRPQNLTSTLPAGERFTIELSDLKVFEDRELEDIVVRALPGGEVQLPEGELESIKKELALVLEEKD